MNYQLQQSVRYAKKVGPQRAALLKKMGIETIGDLLYHFPRRYEDRTVFKPAHTFGHGELATVQGTVLGGQDLKPRKGLTVTKLALHDGVSVFYAVWFNQPYIKKQLPPGCCLLVTGKVERNFGSLQIRVTDFELDNAGDSLHSGRIVPIYPLTENLNQRLLRGIIYTAVEEWSGKLQEFLPPSLLNKYSLPELGEALKQAHFPDDLESASIACKRFIFEELFLFQLALAIRRVSATLSEKPFQVCRKSPLVDRLLKQLPFQLTTAQVRSWEEVSKDMESTFPMSRLLQGDVGSGKTIVATLALLKAIDSGLQGVLMAPTEILAEQHYFGLKDALATFGVEVGLLTGSIKGEEREKILQQVKEGLLPILVGTHALIQEVVEFYKLGLVVIDEQHRFGVRQRAMLQNKGYLPDVLVVTATPIPRTLALTLYGDLDISIISELPPGRRPVKTLVLEKQMIKKAYQMMRDQLKQGRQAYVVCPLVEDAVEEEAGSYSNYAVTKLFNYLVINVFSDYRLGLLHGRMKAGEKEKVMKDFRKGLIDILVTTTVIEVGVDVPNATVMVILDADHFGLAQLHQLRGRVGRGAYQSYCILVANPKTEEAKARLAAIRANTDGFALAEEDLRLRGPGEFWGTRQSGLPDFKIADLARDLRLLENARQEAFDLITRDPALLLPENRFLKEQLKIRFKGTKGYLDIG